MKSEKLSASCLLNIEKRLLPSTLPVLLIAIGYADPGKWAEAIEGGAHFGFGLAAPLLVFNFAAVLCQYMSSLIGFVTGRDLVQICHDEYDKSTCIFLGVLAELSAIALDLTTMLGIAHGLNIAFKVDLPACLFISAIDVVLFPLFASFLENQTARVMGISIVGFIMLSFVVGFLINQPEIPFSMNGLLAKLNGENAFTFMSLLGASIMPHNFFVHSYFVKNQGLPGVSKEALCYDHFFSLLCIFSGIFLMNYMLMTSAVNLFHSTGLVFITFQDVMPLMDQVFKSPTVQLGFLLVTLLSNQIVASTWNVVGQIVWHDLFNMDVHCWLHRVGIRILAILPALNCVWNSGPEGMYQLLLFTQVMVALLLPSSIIPLLRVASSVSIMGAYKISPFLELLALIMFIGMLGLKMMFVMEMIFGNSEWVGILRWNMSSGASAAYIVLLTIACGSFCLMLWLLATPLKSASFRIDDQAPFLKSLGANTQEPDQLQEPSPALDRFVASVSDSSLPNDDINLPETLDQVPVLSTIEESSSGVMCSADLAASVEPAQPPDVTMDVSSNRSLDGNSIEPVDTVGIERDLEIVKDDEDGDDGESEESSKSVASEGRGSFRVPSVKNDDVGNGGGSLSGLAGLGRAARRQVAAILNEFWEQFYDLHGQATAKGKGLDLLLGADPKPSFSFESDSLITYGLFDSPASRGMQAGVDSISVAQQRFSQLWPGHTRLLSPNPNVASIGSDYQPATFHGNQLSSYRAARDLNDQAVPSLLKFASLGLVNNRDPVHISLGQESRDDPRSLPPSYFPNAVSRNNPVQSVPPQGVVGQANSTKYRSLPNISGLFNPPRNPYISDEFGSSLGPTADESMYYSARSRDGARSYPTASPLPFGLSSNSTSLWARQPFEQFGAANKVRGTCADKFSSVVGLEVELLRSVRHFITKLAKVEGSEWLFRQNDGVDEDLVGRVAEARELNLRNDDLGYLPCCGDNCVWKVDLIVSFGVWSVHRILELSLMESRPELWGKYTYVLNHLQGVIDLAFSKPRTLRPPCICLIPLVPDDSIALNLRKGKCTTALSLLALVKDVEMAISHRKGRQGTAAGDVAFPKGKENLASVLKRYKRRLSSKQSGTAPGPAHKVSSLLPRHVV